MKKKFNVIDLFSGCVGFSYGLQQSNYSILLGVDNSEIALSTFKLNHDKSEILNTRSSESVPGPLSISDDDAGAAEVEADAPMSSPPGDRNDGFILGADFPSNSDTLKLPPIFRSVLVRIPYSPE